MSIWKGGLNQQPQLANNKLMGPSDNPLKYSSAGTRYASMHGLMCGADFNEFNQSPAQMFSECDNDWKAMNIRSGVNQTDLPSRFGNIKYGTRKIGNLVFTTENDFGGWLRPKGEW